MIEKTGEGTWHIAAEVANIISCDATQGADGNLVPGPVMSTMMMPSPELQQLENEATSILEGLTSLRREGETLVLEGGSLILQLLELWRRHHHCDMTGPGTRLPSAP